MSALRRRPEPSSAFDWTVSIDLVRRIQTGDAIAETELVARYSRGIRVILAHACSDRGAIDDLYQETFRIAIERIRRGEVREPERLSGFMSSLARNLATQHFRRVARNQRMPVASSTVIAAAPSPGDVLEQRELATLVRRVLSEMPSQRDRRILFRYYIAEDDSDVICADAGITRVHFNRVLFRARERFRKLYERAAGARRTEWSERTKRERNGVS